ncbi:CRIB domain-containing protein RIC6 isoform X2 [Setaria italica]|uniref:CRIB domain-containing protein RIC6 isoform X2 n=1 Tax=Setaria italica TaxID=4555 RepID=UPI000BE522A8|nr:CRIB domain-containing protein RIC6 isoform X2 [Setaria italica]
MAISMKGIFRGLKIIAQIFMQREHEIEIGYPTDVRHVSHVGFGASGSCPSWRSRGGSSGRWRRRRSIHKLCCPVEADLLGFPRLRATGRRRRAAAGRGQHRRHLRSARRRCRCRHPKRRTAPEEAGDEAEESPGVVAGLVLVALHGVIRHRAHGLRRAASRRRTSRLIDSRGERLRDHRTSVHVHA